GFSFLPNPYRVAAEATTRAEHPTPARAAETDWHQRHAADGVARSTIASRLRCCHFVLMVVETLGDAFAAGWRITARCAWGKREGMKSRRECQYTREPDLETLVWTRGPNFPLSRLDARLMCPRCRSRRVAVLFEPPTVSKSARV